MTIKVMATRQGLYGQLREPGELFTIKDEEAFSKRWMKKIQSKRGLAAARANLIDERADELPETDEDTLPDAETFTEVNKRAEKKPTGESWE